MAEQKAQKIGHGKCALTLWNRMRSQFVKEKTSAQFSSIQLIEVCCCCCCLRLLCLLCCLFQHQCHNKHTQIGLWCHFCQSHTARKFLCKLWQIPVGVCWLSSQEQAKTSLSVSLEALSQALHILLVIVTRSVELILPLI